MRHNQISSETHYYPSYLSRSY